MKGRNSEIEKFAAICRDSGIDFFINNNNHSCSIVFCIQEDSSICGSKGDIGSKENVNYDISE